MAAASSWSKYVVAGIVVALAVAAFATLPVGETLQALVVWIRGAGAAGVVAYAAAYVAATVLFIPGAILTLGAGFAYGPLLGLLIVSPVSVLAATTAFLLGRTVARDWVAGRIAADRRFAAIDAAVGRQGFRLVMLLRLSPVFPFNVLNYGLGLTRVTLRHFVLGSFIGMLPGTFLYVYLGSLVTNVSALASDAPASDSAGAAEQAFYWLGLAATIAVTVFVTRIARRALKDTLDDGEAGEPATRKAEA